MKHLNALSLFLSFIFIGVTALAQTTYTWHPLGGSTIYLSATNWQPTRTSPQSNDILLFNNGLSNSIDNVPTQTIGQLVVTSNTTINLGGNGGSQVLTIAGNNGDDLVIEAGSQLWFARSYDLVVLVASGATVSVSGTVWFNGPLGQSYIAAIDAGAIVFNNGSTCSVLNAAHAFGTTNLNSVIFKAGSTYSTSQTTPFGATAPSTVVVFQQGSNYVTSGGGNFAGRTIANLTISANGGFIGDSTSVDTIVCHTNLLLTASPRGFTFRGDITVDSGYTLKFAGNGVFEFAGSSLQHISCSVPVDYGNYPTININNPSGVVSNDSIKIWGTLKLSSGNLSFSQGALTYDQSVPIQGGTLQYNSSSLQTSTDVEFPSTKGPTNLILSNSAGVIIHAARTIRDTLTLGGNGSYTNLSNISGYSNLIYAATVPQITGAELGSSIAKLTINNSSGVTLGGNTNVTGTIALRSGNLTLGSNNLTIPNLATLTGGNASSYVVTNGSGSLIQFVPGGTSAKTLFPVGTGSSYDPVQLNNNGGNSDNYSVRVANAAANVIDPLNVVGVQWTINEAVNGGSSITATFQWNAADEGGSFASSRNFAQIGRYGGSGTNWNLLGGTVAGSDPYTIVSGVMTGTGIFTNSVYGVGLPAALPVELISFMAASRVTQVRLTWSTATEVNNYGFEIERKLGSSPLLVDSWEKVGFVAGTGTSNGPKEYSYTDNGVSSGRYAYRIKQIDKDGSFKYTQTAEVEVGIAPLVFTLGQNYPNPFNPSTNIEFTLPQDGRATLKVYNVLGQEVATLFDNNAEAGRIYQAQFNASRFTSGVYMSVLESGGNRLLRKMVLLK